MCTQYDKDNITEKVRRELRRIISDPAFTPDQVSPVGVLDSCAVLDCAANSSMA